MDALIAVTVFGGTFWLLCALLRWSDHTRHRPPAITARADASRLPTLQVLDGGRHADGDAVEDADGDAVGDADGDAPGHDERQVSRSSGARTLAARRWSGPPATPPAHPGTRAGASSARSA